MKKIVIFNVGGALSAYVEFGQKKSLIDLGASSSFSPIDDFLIPLAKRGKFSTNGSEKYLIDQLFLSHLDNDHISDYKKFRELFHPDYMTCPNDNPNQNIDFKVNRELLGVENENREIVLEDMMKRGTTDTRRPNLPISSSNPLISLTDELSIFYIPPSVCETDEDLKSGYANNISLVLLIKSGYKTILFPGDILKNGMQFLINNCQEFKNSLSSFGLNYLVAPHHGLETSFPSILFETISGNKTDLNIISEKPRSEESEENRSNVDSRYNDTNYSTGNNTLDCLGVKTSTGHIIIDFESSHSLVEKFTNIEDVINQF